jgi:23S rRNA G2069 N7-methylase RlmK/C1962 C5-methylase RlmI
LVIADPPVFGRSRGAAFSLERDLGSLLEGCVASTAAGGVLVFSTHLLSLDEARLVRAVEEAGAARSRSIRVLETLGLPVWDHPAPPPESVTNSAREDRGNYLKTLVLRVG